MPRHQTLHKEIKSAIRLLRGHTAVKKVVIGRYENCRHRYPPGALKILRKTDTGFKLAGYDGSGVYDFFVYLKKLEEPPAEPKAFVLQVETYIKNISK
ncbi:hypothetical protein COTS27_01059 [Spirochaetota bacterium]|nr:hypothetical protein COTS27_01059 [Spirochaetota bacterium]